MPILLDFINQDKFNVDKNGNLMLEELVYYIKTLNNNEKDQIISEINQWLLSNDLQYYSYALYLISKLKISHFKKLLIDKREKVISGKLGQIPKYYSEFIDIALKQLVD